VKALFKIDDPEVEQALAVIIDRLAAARQPANGLPPRPPRARAPSRRRIDLCLLPRPALAHMR
jgi:hypothetical protein